MCRSGIRFETFFFSPLLLCVLLHSCWRTSFRTRKFWESRNLGGTGLTPVVLVVIRVLVARAPGGAQVLSAYGGRPGRPPVGYKRVGGSPLASLGVHGAGRLGGPGRPLPRGLHTVSAPGLNRAGASPGPPYYALSIRRLRQSATLTQHTHKNGGREYYTRSG